MADITLTVDVSSLADASKKLKAFGAEVSKFSAIGLSRGINTLQNNIRELVSAQRQGTIGSSTYQLGLLQIKRAYEQMGYSTQAATAAVRKYAAELQRQEAARAAEQAARELARAQQEAAAAAQKLADRQRDLRRRFQDGYAQFERQRQAMRDLREAYRANIITLDQYQAKLAQIRAGGGDLTRHINQQSTGLNRFGVITQQAGYQVGDFFVQVQSGTNVLVAFGQQATQLIGTFAALSTSVKAIAAFSVLGVLVSIGTAIGSYFMRASGSSDTLSQKFDKLKTSTDKVNQTFSLLQKKDLSLQFGNMTTSVESLSTAMLELDRSAQLKNLLGTIGKLGEQANAGFFRQFGEGFLNIGRFVDPFSDVKGPQQVNEEAFNKLGFQMARSQFLSYTEELKRLASAGDTEGVLKVFDEFLVDATDAGTAVGKISTEGYAVADGMRSALLAVAETAALLNGSAKDAERLVEAEKTKVQHAERYYQIQLEQDALNKERDADVQSLIALRNEEYNRLVQERDMLQAIYAFGKDSVEVRELEAQIAREAYQSDLARKGLKGNFLTLLMEEYDATAAVKRQIEEAAGKTALLEEGMSQAAVDALEFAGIDLSSGVSAAAKEAAVLAANMNMTLSDALSFINMVDSQVYGKVGARGDPRKFVSGGPKPFVPLDDETGGGREAKLRKQIDLTKELTQVEKDRQTILQSIEGSLESGFLAMVDGTKSVKDAFRSMAAEIIKELYRVLVVQRLVGGISGAVNMLTLPAGPSTGTLGLPKFATGGSMMPGGSYIVGENGPELVIPRHSGTVVNANQTANAMGGGGGFTQNLSINVSGSDSAMVRTEIAKMIPQITNATKAAVIDAKQRGGQMAQAFR